MTLSPMAKAAVVLGLLSAVGPFAIDMFLPAMPAIAADLGATVGATQGTITFYFVTFGLAQILYGPLSDQVGRKMPIFIGLSIFFVGAIAATLAPTIELLVAARAFQGAGAAALMVVVRAIIRDQFTGYEATRLMSLVMLVFSVSPMFAPLVGAGLIATTGWRVIFAFMALSAVLAALLTWKVQPETLAPKDRVKVNLPSLMTGAKRLMIEPVFLSLTFIGGFGLAAFFVFIASAAFVYEHTYALSPTQFALAFAVNAMGFIGASQAAAPLMQRIGVNRLVLTGVVGFATVLVALTAILAMTELPVIGLVLGLIFAFGFLGLVVPTAMVASLDPHGDIAGLASSLGGTLQMIAGGLMVAFTGPFFDGTPLPMVGAMAVCALVALALALWVRRAGQVAPAE